ncbi:MAG: hypothetical protein M3Q39_03015 [Actinomycetota bacterium]|nr:hypothetical protein [Actinomycetota bacterium]
MARTTVNIDGELLDQARRALGTKAVTTTVNAALAAAVRQARLEAFDVRLFDVTDEEIAEVRRDRTGGASPST